MSGHKREVQIESNFLNFVIYPHSILGFSDLDAVREASEERTDPPKVEREYRSERQRNAPNMKAPTTK